MISARVQSVKIGFWDYPVEMSVLESDMELICTKLAEQNRNLDTFTREPVQNCPKFICTQYMAAIMKITKWTLFIPILCKSVQSLYGCLQYQREQLTCRLAGWE